jgi:ParB family chromosome partitioning protein
MSARSKKPAATEEPVVRLIPIDKVVLPTENRDDLGDMERLTESVKARGVAQPILVRPGEDGTYQLVFGERRLRAAKAAGNTTIKAEIRELDDLEATFEQIAENMDRKDLTSLEKAKALRRALEAAKRQGVRLGQREWAARLGKSQATVSKYLTLLVIYTEFPAFKQAYDAGQATDTDAIHLGRLVRQVGKQPELVERVLSRGLRFGMENEVNTELKSHERRQARAKVMTELEEHGVILAPDDWRSTGARSLATLGLDAEAHRSEPCHAVWVDSASRLDPICMNPERHAPPPASSPSSNRGGGRAEETGSPGVNAAPPEKGSSSKSGAPPSSSGSDGAAAQEEERRQREEAERRAREEDERRRREEAERARVDELEAAGDKRWETLRTWLTSSGRLSRPLSDGYVFWQVVNLLAEHRSFTANACGLLGVEVGDSGSWDGLLGYAKKGSEQLRRAALALVLTWAEDRVRTEQDWLDPFIQEHYRLLAELGYEPCEVETQELASAPGVDDPGAPGQDQTESGDS